MRACLRSVSTATRIMVSECGTSPGMMLPLVSWRSSEPMTRTKMVPLTVTPLLLLGMAPAVPPPLEQLELMVQRVEAML
jgi:hypothetical protein